MKTLLVLFVLLTLASCGKKSSETSDSFNIANDVLDFVTVDNNDRLGIKMAHFSSGRVVIMETAFYYNYRNETATYPPIYALEATMTDAQVRAAIAVPGHQIYKCRENTSRIDEWMIGCFRGEWF